MNQLCMDYLSGAAAADMDLSGSGKSKKQKRKEKLKKARAKARKAALARQRAEMLAQYRAQTDADLAAAEAAAMGAPGLSLIPGVAPAPAYGGLEGEFAAQYQTWPYPGRPGAAPVDEMGSLYETVGRGVEEDAGAGGPAGARMLDLLEFDQAPTRGAIMQPEIDLEEEDYIWGAEGSGGLPFLTAVNGSGCGCETYRRYPRRSGVQRPF
jgi:hypothetical protein